MIASSNKKVEKTTALKKQAVNHGVILLGQIGL